MQLNVLSNDMYDDFDEDDQSDANANEVDATKHNEMLRRKEMIDVQQQILREYDEMEDLLLLQLDEIQQKGWNVHYRDVFFVMENNNAT